MRRKFFTLIVCFLFCILLTGCSVASEKEIKKYANEKYGKATLIRTEELSDEERKCYFKDEEYGFEYYVSSYMHDIVIDGSDFGATENKASDFERAYYNYMVDVIKDDLALIEKEYDVEISVSDGTSIYYFARIQYHSADTSNVAEVSKKVSDLFTSIDTREYWEELDVEAYDSANNYLGAYHYQQERWMTPEDEVDLFYIEKITNLTSKAVYVGKELHPFTDTGIDITDVVHVLGNPEIKSDSTVTYYIFTVDGKEYYMCDFMVLNDIGGHEYYTNYEK